MTGFIGNIQRFSVGDGPGIRTTVFFQGCSLLCPWCHNPEYLPKTGGKAMTISGILAILEEDRPFYDASGGGVTFSGGEPVEQAKFCLELAKACQEAGFSILLDTAGQAPLETYTLLLPYIAQYYVDLKGFDEEKTRKTTGTSPARAVALMQFLQNAGKKVTARLPLIPGYTDDQQAVLAMAALLVKAGVEDISLLPFHNWASGKYKELQKPNPYEQTAAMDKSVANTLLQAIKQAFPGKFSLAVGG